VLDVVDLGLAVLDAVIWYSCSGDHGQVVFTGKARMENSVVIGGLVDLRVTMSLTSTPRSIAFLDLVGDRSIAELVEQHKSPSFGRLFDELQDCIVKIRRLNQSKASCTFPE